jgi:hypothetical protein
MPMPSIFCIRFRCSLVSLMSAIIGAYPVFLAVRIVLVISFALKSIIAASSLAVALMPPTARGSTKIVSET